MDKSNKNQQRSSSSSSNKTFGQNKENKPPSEQSFFRKITHLTSIKKFIVNKLFSKKYTADVTKSGDEISILSYKEQPEFDCVSDIESKNKIFENAGGSSRELESYKVTVDQKLLEALERLANQKLQENSVLPYETHKKEVLQIIERTFSRQIDIFEELLHAYQSQKPQLTLIQPQIPKKPEIVIQPSQKNELDECVKVFLQDLIKNFASQLSTAAEQVPKKSDNNICRESESEMRPSFTKPETGRNKYFADDDPSARRLSPPQDNVSAQSRHEVELEQLETLSASFVEPDGMSTTSSRSFARNEVLADSKHGLEQDRPRVLSSSSFDSDGMCSMSSRSFSQNEAPTSSRAELEKPQPSTSFANPDGMHASSSRNLTRNEVHSSSIIAPSESGQLKPSTSSVEPVGESTSSSRNFTQNERPASFRTPSELGQPKMSASFAETELSTTRSFAEPEEASSNYRQFPQDITSFGYDIKTEAEVTEPRVSASQSFLKLELHQENTLNCSEPEASSSSRSFVQESSKELELQASELEMGQSSSFVGTQASTSRNMFSSDLEKVRETPEELDLNWRTSLTEQGLNRAYPEERTSVMGDTTLKVEADVHCECQDINESGAAAPLLLTDNNGDNVPSYQDSDQVRFLNEMD